MSNKTIKDYKTFSYSLEEFEGYSHRFIYKYFNTEKSIFSTIQMFTNNGNKKSVEELLHNILVRKFPLCLEYPHEFLYFGTKEEDDINNEFINLLFKD